ncbi:hypothetical protein STND_1326 [Streptococcus thermophilus ND03]|nr:hypothetical protein STND_1326 [Streptococcus thermophilus ND03]AFJ83748.1 hypothetical protein Y1U_C1299 [Streptococcus thermophilus MN-ZLW-002]AKB97999.1 hypothetical protein SMQ301_1379 [Streptococcus thermophilus]AOZ59549.1 hypothetical protein BBD27_1465 [Streptococcus thermophilus]CAD0167878.1 protein of unknown function [Streptococcus thermophilus]
MWNSSFLNSSHSLVIFQKIFGQFYFTKSITIMQKATVL